VTATETKPLWAVGTYADEHGRPAPWEISHDEINRDIGVATSVLTELGVAGRRVLWCSMLSQAGQHWPYVCGTVLAGAKLSCADSTFGEAMRVSMFLRLMDYDAVLGVTPGLLDGLEASGRAPADVFASVRIVGAYPGAYERLAADGLTPWRVALCGPALAIGRGPGGPAYVPPSEWELVDLGDRVGITALQPRATAFIRTPIALRGTIVDRGIVPTTPEPVKPANPVNKERPHE
jgi:hypothetical protein